MTNGDRIRQSDNEHLAIFLHLCEAGAIINGADSEAWLMHWLESEEDEDEDDER